ncbi:MAG: hypothetical protein WCL30_04115, partial [Pseudomonadota bacterium]
MENFRRNIIGYLIIIIIGLGLAYAVEIKSKSDTALAMRNYKEQSQIKAEQTAKSISNSFKLLYQGIRTISRLPSVRDIDRYGKNLDRNAHASIEQIYRNMVTNIAVSEIYIVPADLEPEQIDLTTGELQTPILMYDGSEEKPSEEAKPKIKTVADAANAEEVEIYEYRLLKEQMQYFKANYPDELHAHKLDLPIIAGQQVLTCDNDDFKKTKLNSDRTGLVFSLPFFLPEGKFKGTISAIIRNNVISSMLPESNFAITAPDYAYV